MVENNLLKALAEQVERERAAMMNIRQIIKEAREQARRETREESVDIFVEQRPVEVSEQFGGESTTVTAETAKSVERMGQPRLLRPGEKIKVFVVEGQVLLSQALHPCLSQTPDIEVVGESEDFIDDVILKIEEMASDVALVDVNLPSLSGLDLARRIIECIPGISVILLAPYDDDDLILVSLKVGVAGYLSSNITRERVVDNIRRVFAGHRPISQLLIRPAVARQVLNSFQGAGKEVETAIGSISPQQVKILGYFADGYSIQEVAHKLAKSEDEIMDDMSCIVSSFVNK